MNEELKIGSNVGALEGGPGSKIVKGPANRDVLIDAKGNITRYLDDQPAPGVTPPKTLQDRYSVGKTAIDNSGAYDLPKPDKNTFLEEARQRAQSLVNAVNSKFASIEASDREAIDLMNREQRASNVMSGLSGSTSGSARTIQTAKQGEALQKRTASQKASEIESIYTDAETRGTNEFLNERNAYISQQKDRLSAEQGLRDKIQTQAFSELDRLGSNGQTLADIRLKNPKLVEKYMEETGLDESGLESYLLTKTPKGEIINKEGTKLADGTVVYHSYTKDEQGNITGVKEIGRVQGTGGKAIEKSEISSDGIFILYKDGTTEFKKTYTGKEASKNSSTTKSTKEEKVSKDEEFAKADKIILENPTATENELKSLILRNTELDTTDINALVGARKPSITDIKNLAKGFTASNITTGFFSSRSGELESAKKASKDLVKQIRDAGGKVEINGNEVHLSEEQLSLLEAEIDALSGRDTANELLKLKESK